MKKKNLLDAFGEIDDKFVDSAEKPTDKNAKKERSYYTKLIPAACAALAVICVVVPIAAKSNDAKKHTDTVKLDGSQSGTSTETELQTVHDLLTSPDSGGSLTTAPETIASATEIEVATESYDIPAVTDAESTIAFNPPVTAAEESSTVEPLNIPKPFGGFVYNEVKALLGDTTGETQITIESQYLTEIEDEGYSAYKSCRVVSADKVGEKIGDTTVSAAIFRYIDKTKTDETTLRAEIYTLIGVSHEFAICLKFLDSCEYLSTTMYYSYINSAMCWDYLAGFWSVCGNCFMKVESYSLCEGVGIDEKMTSYEYNAVLASNIAKILNDMNGNAVKNIPELEKIIASDSLRVNITISTFTENLIRATVYNSGYISLRVGDEVYVYKVPTGASSYLIDSIRQMGNKALDEITVVTSAE